MNTLSLHRPAALTKELAVGASSDGGRRVVISSNFLDLYGFTPSSRYERVLLGAGGAGFTLRLNAAGVQQVYRRTYTQRRSNPFETQIDVRAQDFISAALPAWTERVHITMQPGELRVRPVPNQAFHIRKRFRESTDLSALMALSSGIDAHCVQSLGFDIAAMIEWRPPEKRDGSQDLTESGVLTALANVKPSVVLNEDVTRVEVATVRQALRGRTLSLLHICVQCDDYSQLKSAAAKRLAVEDGSSTRDMIYDALRLTDGLRPAALLIECVAPFATSPECDMARVRLGRWGYHTSLAILDARDFGGYTSRRRAYLVASLFPDFAFPAALPRRTTPIWAEFGADIAECRDVSGSLTVEQSLTSDRAAHLTADATYAPCLMKSQSHMTKDALYLRTPDGRMLFPTERLFARLNEIPDDFDWRATTQSLALEQIGQSISYRMHHALMASVKSHLQQQRGIRFDAVLTNAAAAVRSDPARGPTADDRSGAALPGQGEFTFA